MNELSTNTPSDFGESISNFHDNVEKLYNEQPKNVFESIRRRFTTWSVVKSDKKISSEIASITKQAENILNKLPENINSLKSLHDQLDNKDLSQIKAGDDVITKEQLQGFCKDMDRLFKEIYPRAEISPFSKVNKMPKPVQEYYSEDVRNLRMEKVKDPTLVSKEEHKINRKIAKGKLAIDLGRGIKKNTGTTGTLIILDVNGKPMGIHKVSKQHVPLANKIQRFFRNLFGGQVSCLSNSDLAQPLAERASYILNKELKFDLAPASKIATLKELDGVFQVYISREKDQGILQDVKKAEIIVAEKSSVNTEVKGPND
ncbi:MAG TPA: hypothetical protein VGP47_05455 [Parachlamydiaceae bacterium]|nr:hypothetical protein [Parachlamydiaceae bacterium]